ncbi:MAG: SLC13 family permease [Planctomycetota bacterium]
MTNSLEESLPEGLCRAGRWLAPVVVVAMLACPAPAGLPISAWRLVAVTLGMAVLWFTQGIPVAATSLIPLLAYPVLGIQKADDVAKSYIDSNVWLALGGFIIALGIERWGLHRRMALHVLCSLGTSPRRIVLGFMIATAFLSMWISNTAATLMMLPIGLALLRTLEEIASGENTASPNTNGTPMPWLPILGTALVLGIAYAASIGGTLTPVGTPTNVVFLGMWRRQFPGAPEIPSGQWILSFLPFGIVMILVSWIVLTWYLPRNSHQNWLRPDFFRTRLKQLGPATRGERWMLFVFVSTALLWVFRAKFQIGDEPLVLGWGYWLEMTLKSLRWAGDFKASYLHDATVSIGMCLLMFCVPVEKDAQGRTSFLMDWETAQRLPWDVVLLFGGGFAMAGAFESTGLAHWIGDQLTAAVTIRSIVLWMLIITASLTFLTEFTSNVATANMFLPIVASISVSLGYDPRLLMIPATISTSVGFMMPVGTPPNAIAFGTGRVRFDQMIKYGFILNIVGIVLVSATTLLWMVPVMKISIQIQPSWAVNQMPAAPK